MNPLNPRPLRAAMQSSIECQLQRILLAVEPRKRKPALEILTALLLSFATVGSAWCAYQSKLWSGAQNARTNASFRAGRDSALKNLAAIQARTFDASMFIQFIEARAEGNQKLENFLRKRFRGDMKPALEAWLIRENDPSAPASPFQMAEYAQTELVEAAQKNEVADKALAAAREARKISDNYTLHTVLFASMLFFGGISRSFASRRIQLLLMLAAILLFIGTLYTMGTLPICSE